MRLNGFTLLEILVVIAIVTVLAVLIGAIINDTRISGRDAERVAELREAQKSLELYYDDFKQYPASLAALAPAYAPTVPTDPLTKMPYFYDLLSGGSSYRLGANLEQRDALALGTDLDLAEDTGTIDSGLDTAGCGGEPSRACFDIGP